MKTLVVQLPKRITEHFMAHFKALVMNLMLVITTKKKICATRTLFSGRSQMSKDGISWCRKFKFFNFLISVYSKFLLSKFA